MFLREKYYLNPETQQVVAGNPVGAVAIRVKEGRRMAEYQVSVLNPLDRFDRAMARQLALGRLAEAPFTVPLPKNATMDDITRAVMMDIMSDPGAVSRARKAAKLWLHWNT